MFLFQEITYSGYQIVHFGSIAREEGEPGGLVLMDVGALVRRLVLFEQWTIESITLKEVPALIAVFGANGLLKLIDSGAVRVVCDAMTAGQIGQAAGLRATLTRGALPFGSYRIVSVGIAQEGEGRQNYIQGRIARG
jgi:hypothetical protein